MASPHSAALWRRGVAAAAASLVALASTGAIVRAAVVVQTGSGPAIILASDGHGDGNGNGNGEGKGRGNGSGKGSDGKGDGGSGDLISAVISALKPDDKKPKTPKVTPEPQPARPARSVPHTGHVTPHAPTSAPASRPTSAPTPPPTARVVVDGSDPAPFSAQAATDAARVLPVERLGPLSGISFGSGLFIWPLLLAVDAFALAVIARMALRRRLVASED